MHRNAPARGAVGDGSVVVSAGSVATAPGSRGSLIPHAGAIRPLVIAMIEPAFRTAAMALARGADRIAGAPPRDTPVEQYAWPRSHDAQIAKRPLQRRQIFWRSGVSTPSERRRASTGHGGQTVAQERRPARSPSEHRGGHRGSGGINSRPSPHSPQSAAYATTAAPFKPRRAMDADRDRGTPRDVTPPTPPGIRVRTTAVRPVERHDCSR